MTEHTQEPDPVRIGLLGCADIALRRILPAVAGRRDAVLTAAASRSLPRAEKAVAEFGGRAVEGYDRLLASPDVDAVYLPLPPALHAPWIERALAAGKHVLAEKPLTLSGADTERLHRAADDAGLVLRENFMFPNHRLHARIGALLSDGAIGRVHSLHSTFAIPRRPEGDIRYDAGLGGGALLDVGGYPVRSAVHYFGTGLEVLGACAPVEAATGVDVHGSALLRTPGGTAVHCDFGLDHQYTSELRFLGSRGRIEAAHVFTTPADAIARIRIRTPEGEREEAVPPDDQVAGAVDAFLGAIAAGRTGTTRATREQARIIDRIRQCADDPERTPQ